jgi:hypothetical protein
MRQLIRAGFISIFILILGTVSMAADLRDGFMAYQWGEDISRYDELTELHTKGDFTYYSHPGESYSIDDISINDVVFGFYKDQLFAVYVGIDSFETYDKINMHMKNKYGLPDTKISAKDYLTTYKWKYQDVSIKLKTGQIDGKMKLAFYYRPLSGDIKKEQLDATSETSYRFFPIDKNKTPKLVPFLEF